MILKFEKMDRAHVSGSERQQLRYQELAAILGEYGYLTAWNPDKYPHFSMRNVGSSQEIRVRVSGRLLLHKDMLGGITGWRFRIRTSGIWPRMTNWLALFMGSRPIRLPNPGSVGASTAFQGCRAKLRLF